MALVKGFQRELLKIFRHEFKVSHTGICQTRKTLLRTYSSSSNNDITAKAKIVTGPGLEYFIANADGQRTVREDNPVEEENHYLTKNHYDGQGRKVFFETYGCQMNVNDTEIAWSILQENGFSKTSSIKESDVVLVMTCAVREGAEEKIWNRLEYLKYLKRRRAEHKSKPQMMIAIIGCMAERLKTKIVEREKLVDVVCGPDAYRDLPRLLAITHSGQAAVNVLLSLEETYADVIPVRLNANSPSAFVSIMRGCDNMCSYCIVPFTRGRERSRPISSILDEVRLLSEQGVKEVTLLGQNVNSYRDKSEVIHSSCDIDNPSISKGFKTIYKSRKGGLHFADLLDKVSVIDPEMRIRFTSPHPKDFPDAVLRLIQERANICNQLHMPAQSGSTHMLEMMRRGYTREAYIDLVEHVRDILPNVSLSSDFIAGFCGETEEDHQHTISLMKLVKYNFAFCFPYSMRQKTNAYHRLQDNVPPEVKGRRHEELITIFREEALKLNIDQMGEIQLVLTEGISKRSDEELAGRTDGNTKVIFANKRLPEGQPDQELSNSEARHAQSGDYVAVRITGGSSQVLKAQPLYITTLAEFNRTKQT